MSIAIKFTFTLIIIVASFFMGYCSQDSNFPVLTGPYLGQKPPGSIPEIFAQNILNTEKTRAFGSVFSPGGNEFYCVHFEKSDDLSGGIVRMRRVNNIWIKPELLHFNSETWDNDMCLSADGNLIIFRSFRTIPDWNKPENEAYLWYAKRTENGWSKAKPLFCGGKPVSTVFPSIAKNSDLYFSIREKEKSGIYRARAVDRVYSTPEHVFSAVDSAANEGDMYVAPDESYMIISCSRHQDNIGGSKWGDLYITFKMKDGTWCEEINMGDPINTRIVEYCPQVTPDGKYLFFTRYNPETKNGDIYWMDAKVIEQYRPDKDE
ncbi:MAG: hypothetical protein GY863_01425 [bacterium]|nr:hypothetical protein [bacterium]